MDLTIRPETGADFDAVERLVQEAFTEDEEVAPLVRAIREGDGYIPALALVAEVDGELVGHVMVSHSWLVEETGSHRVAILSPLAVKPGWQRQGVGSALVRRVTGLAEEMGEPVVILEGSPIYYARFGFEASTPLGISIDLPDWAPPEAAQVLRLGAYNPGLRGRLVFEALDRVRREQGVEPTAGGSPTRTRARRIDGTTVSQMGIDHVGLGVPDVAAARAYYDEFMPLVGFVRQWDTGYRATDWYGPQIFFYPAVGS